MVTLATNLKTFNIFNDENFWPYCFDKKFILFLTSVFVVKSDTSVKSAFTVYWVAGVGFVAGWDSSATS